MLMFLKERQLLKVNSFSLGVPEWTKYNDNSICFGNTTFRFQKLVTELWGCTA